MESNLLDTIYNVDNGILIRLCLNSDIGDDLKKRLIGILTGDKDIELTEDLLNKELSKLKHDRNIIKYSINDDLIKIWASKLPKLYSKKIADKIMDMVTEYKLSNEDIDILTEKIPSLLSFESMISILNNDKTCIENFMRELFSVIPEKTKLSAKDRLNLLNLNLLTDRFQANIVNICSDKLKIGFNENRYNDILYNCLTTTLDTMDINGECKLINVIMPSILKNNEFVTIIRNEDNVEYEILDEILDRMIAGITNLGKLSELIKGINKDNRTLPKIFDIEVLTPALIKTMAINLLNIIRKNLTGDDEICLYIDYINNPNDKHNKKLLDSICLKYTGNDQFYKYLINDFLRRDDRYKD